MVLLEAVGRTKLINDLEMRLMVEINAIEAEEWAAESDKMKGFIIQI